MVIVNPKLSLPTDLPYKKRQSPFNPHSALQAATVRYNEAIRKQYNDIQFAKGFEIGCISQNELTPVNTVDVGKYLDQALMSEMSRLNPLPSTGNKNRKFRRLEICKGAVMSDDVPSALPHSSITETRFFVPTPPDGALTKTNCSTRYDCCCDNIDDNNEMFPRLGVGNDHHDKCASSSRASPLGRSIKQSRSLTTPEHSNNNNNVQVLEAQAIHEYSPTDDSAHDMIFGNVMGLDYGNYVHDRLWPTTIAPSWNPAAELIADQRDTCTVSKSAGYNLAGGCGSRDTLKSSGELLAMNVGGSSSAGHSSSTGSSRRSTSVPRPRTGSRKETLKQAAIRCGIIKGNCNVIQKRTHYLVPLQLQSDQTVPVVEILHPRSLIPTCSSEALVEEMKDQIADAEFKKDEEVVVSARDTKSNANLLLGTINDVCGRSRRDSTGMLGAPLPETCSDDGSYNNSRSNARRGEVRSTVSDQYT